MKLWHKDLIPVLPNQQLLEQWRDCCLIAKGIAENETQSHLWLVGPVMEYPLDHLIQYQFLIWKEMTQRGCQPDEENFYKWIPDGKYDHISANGLFKGWHNGRYLSQCYRNLQKKHDCGDINDEEWKTVVDYCRKYYSLSGFLERRYVK